MKLKMYTKDIHEFKVCAIMQNDKIIYENNEKYFIIQKSMKTPLDNTK